MEVHVVKLNGDLQVIPNVDSVGVYLEDGEEVIYIYSNFNCKLDKIPKRDIISISTEF